LDINRDERIYFLAATRRGEFFYVIRAKTRPFGAPLKNAGWRIAMNHEPLSHEGSIRREQILALAHQTAHRRRNFRLARPVAIALVPIAIVVGMVIRMPLPTPVSQQVVVHATPAVILQPGIAVEYLQTDPTITDRLTLPPVQPRWTSIDDRQLLDELAAAGQPAGIVCMNGKTFLLPRANLH
jgi:hypothetical protein